MVIHVAGARLHGGNQRQLFSVHIFNQLSKFIVAVCRPGTGKVSGIAVIFRPSIQQEAADFSWCAVIQLGVVQHRRMLVQRHDVAVRHIGVAMAGSRQIGLVDIKLAHAGTEGFFCRTVAVDRHLLRFTHTRQFIVSLIGAIVVQVVNHPFRVDVARSNAQAQRTLRNRTNIADVATCSGQLAANAVRFWQRNNFNLFCPERSRQRFYVVPVINRQVEPQLWFINAIHQQPAVWHLSHRHPCFELRVDLERVRVVIQKNIHQLARVDKQRIEFETVECVTCSLL